VKVSAIPFVELKLRKKKFIIYCKWKFQQGHFSLWLLFCIGCDWSVTADVTVSTGMSSNMEECHSLGGTQSRG
jgi:hypothetical protein